MSLSNHIDELESMDSKKKKMMLRSEADYWLEILDKLLVTKHYKDPYEMALCLPVLIPYIKNLIHGSFKCHGINELIYHSDQYKKTHSLPYSFDESCIHTVLSGHNARLWIWNNGVKLPAGGYSGVLLAYKEYGKQTYLYSKTSEIRDQDKITASQMTSFFEDFQRKIETAREWRNRL